MQVTNTTVGVEFAPLPQRGPTAGFKLPGLRSPRAMLGLFCERSTPEPRTSLILTASTNDHNPTDHDPASLTSLSRLEIAISPAALFFALCHKRFELLICTERRRKQGARTETKIEGQLPRGAPFT